MSSLLPSSVERLREAVLGQGSELRATVLQGGFNDLHSMASWKTPTFKLLVFVSSTFTDTQLERNFLMDELLFELRNQAAPQGIQVIFVDMRWGVRDENSCDHKTWIECANALNWCKTESMGIFFLSLQADKYGYTPLPKTLDQETVDNHLRDTGCTPELQALIRDWYELDANANPPEYSLRNLEDHNDPRFWDAYGRMLSSLEGIEFDINRYPNLSVGRSVTEWEVRAALSPHPVERDFRTSFFWSNRHFNGDEANRSYCDHASDTALKAKFNELRAFMEQKFEHASVKKYNPQLTLSDLLDVGGTVDNALRKEYLEQFQDTMRKVLTDSMRHVIYQKSLWTRHGCNVGICGDRLEEMLHHLQWAHQKCQQFECREELVQKALSYIFAPPRQLELIEGVEEINQPLNAISLAGICVCLIGSSGAGKTALTAKLASEVYRIDRSGAAASEEGSGATLTEGRLAENLMPRPVITRFCGTSPGSKTARALMISICEQIEFIYKLKRHILPSEPDTSQSNGTEERKTEDQSRETVTGSDRRIEYDELVSYFHLLLLKNPVVLFIDSLDQLSDEDQGRSQLTFLRGLKPHPLTRVIVSSLPDEYHIANKDWLYLYMSETRLREAEVPRVNVSFAKFPPEPVFEPHSCTNGPADSVSEEQRAAEQLASVTAPLIDPPAAEAVSSDPIVIEPVVDLKEVERLLERLLSKRCRRLTDEQWDLVRRKIAIEPTALYVNIALDVVSQWSSSLVPPADNDQGENVLLEGGVQNLIKLRFRTLERDFGQKLVRAALGFLTYSAKGVSDVEMEDLLSLNDEVLDAVFQYATPDVRRLPSHVWLRLKGALGGLVVEGQYNCLAWYHRQLRETAADYFSSERTKVQTIMALYFGNLVEQSMLRERRISTQHWTLCGKKWFDSTSIANVRRGSEASVHLVATAQWERAEKELCSFEGVCGKIRGGEGFQLVQHMNVLENEFRRLCIASAVPAERVRLNTLWERVQHYLRWLREDIMLLIEDCLSQFTFSASVQPATSVVWQESRDFIKSCHALGDSPPFIGGIQVGSKDDFDALLGKLKGHRRSVFAVAFSPNGKSLASGGEDGTIRLWDRINGSTILRLEGHLKSVRSLDFSPDSKSLASGSEDLTVRVWDVASGITLCNFGYNAFVSAVAFGPAFIDQPLLLATAAMDGQLLVWNVEKDTTVLNGAESELAPIHAIAFCPSGKTCITGVEDGKMFIWEISTGLILLAAHMHTERVNALRFSSNGKQLLSGSNDRRAFIWNYEDLSVIRTFDGHKGPVMAVAFTCDQTPGCMGNGTRNSVHHHVVTSSWDQTLCLWNYDDENAVGILRGHEKGVYGIDVNKNEGQIASGSGDAAVLFWDVSKFKPSEPREGNMSGGHTRAVNAVAISPDGLRVASASADLSIRIWDAIAGVAVAVLGNHAKKPVLCIAYSPDGDWMASGSDDKVIRLWRTSAAAGSPTDMRCLTGHTRAVLGVAFSPKTVDTKLIASCSIDCTVRIWGPLSPDGSIPGESKALDKHKERVQSVEFSPDGQCIICTSGYGVHLQDIATGAILASFNGHMWFSTGASFMPCTDQVGIDGANRNPVLAVSCSDDKSLQVWDIANGPKHHYLRRLMGHTDRVCGLSASDSGVIASCSWDHSVRLWDYWGSCLAVLYGHSARVNSVCLGASRPRAVHSDTSMCVKRPPELLISGSEDGKVRIWHLDLLRLPPIKATSEEDVRTQIIRQATEAKRKGEWLIHGVDFL